jgi:hypothetical protein
MFSWDRWRTTPQRSRSSTTGVGNRVEERPAGQAPVIYTPDTLNQYQQRAGQAFTYDAQGNLRTDGTREWIYDYRSQLVAVRDIATGTVVLRLGHDALGPARAADGRRGPIARWSWTASTSSPSTTSPDRSGST